jgi:DNA-binding NarL/FixJ family response regulator
VITHVIIWGATRLHRAAWAALLARQPGLRVAGAEALLVRGQPSAFPIDAPAPQAEFVRQLRAAYPVSGTLVLVAAYDVDQLTTLFQAGATGCLGYNESVSDLARSLIAVGRGEVVLPPAVAADVLMPLRVACESMISAANACRSARLR